MKRFKNILCVVDTRVDCKHALQRAVELAENNQASLAVINVMTRDTAGIGMPDGGPICADLQAARLKAHTQAVENLLEPFREQIEINIRILSGTAFLEIIREVLRNEYDLVIKTPETQDWLDPLFGSDDMHLLRKCPCPVWLIKPSAAKSYRRILAAVDIDEIYPEDEQKPRCVLNHQILEMASSLSLSNFAELHIVHVWDAIGESALGGPFVNAPEQEIVAYIEKIKQLHAASLDALITDVTSKLGVDALDYLKPQKHLIKGWARKEIPVFAKSIEADLIVMGTVGRTGIPGFIIGNTAETILNNIDCSVLAIKPPGFETPVTLMD